MIFVKEPIPAKFLVTSDGIDCEVETELQKICDTILGLLTDNLIPKTTQGESIVFYQKMKGDYYRYIAEFTDGDKKSAAAENARKSYDEAQKVQYAC